MVGFDQSDIQEKNYNLVLMRWKTKETKVLNAVPSTSPPCPVFVKSAA